MTRWTLVCIAWIAAALSLRAESIKLPFLTVGEMTYSNVTVMGANASDLFFTSDHGIRNVKLKFLSPDMQRMFHYDPVEAEKAEEQQAEDEKRYQQNLAAQLASEYNAAREAHDTQAQAPYAAAGLADPVADSNSPVGKPGPDLEFERWVGARPITDGKVTLVFLWSPKSISCRKWIPALNDLHKNFADRITFVGVAPPPDNEIALADPKPEFPTAVDTDPKFVVAANITTYPCVMLMDAKHIVRYEGHPAALTPEILQSIFKPAE